MLFAETVHFHSTVNMIQTEDMAFLLDVLVEAPTLQICGKEGSDWL
jgi:hypothetical protein